MTKKEIDLVMKLKDEVSKRINTMEGHMNRFSRDFKKHWVRNTAAVVAGTYAVKKFTDGLVSIEKELISVNAKFERWEVQMRTFTNSTKEARAVMQDMVNFSVATPFTPEEVIGAGKILKPLEEMGFELDDTLKAAGNAAVAFGLTFEQSAMQIVRSFTSGIGSADLFRDRGVRSFIEVSKGIDLTKLSAEELRQVMMETFTTGTIGDAMRRESQTFQGLISTLQGEYMMFQQQVGEDVFEDVKADLRGILSIITDSKEEGGEYAEVVDQLGEFFSEAYASGKQFAGAMLVAGGQLIDIWNEVHLMINGAHGALLMTVEQLLIMKDGFKETGNEAKNFLESFANYATFGLLGDGEKEREVVEQTVSNLDLVRAEIFRLSEETQQLMLNANQDYSMQMQNRLQEFLTVLEFEKEAVRKNEEEKIQIVADSNEEQTGIVKTWQEMQAKWEEKFARGKLALARDVIEQSAEFSKEAAMVMQGIRIAEAIMNTAAGVTLALSSYPPPVNFMWAGLVAAYGAAQIQTIRSAKLAEGTDSVPAMLSPGEMVFPRSMANAIRSGDIVVSGRRGDGPGGPAGSNRISNYYDQGRPVTIENISIYVTIQSTNNARQIAEEIGYEVYKTLGEGHSTL